MSPAFVSAAAELGTTDTETLRRLYVALMTDRLGRGPAASTSNIDSLETGLAGARVASVDAVMATIKYLVASFITMRHGILARCPWLLGDFLKRCLSARAVRHDIR